MFAFLQLHSQFHWEPQEKERIRRELEEAGEEARPIFSTGLVILMHTILCIFAFGMTLHAAHRCQKKRRRSRKNCRKCPKNQRTGEPE